LVVTSRAMLRVSGEQAYEISPLPVRAEGQDGTAIAGEDAIPAAVRLFAERARALSSSFAVTDENRRVIEEICVRLDGLPLGIELAAARVNLLPPDAILDRLERKLPLPGRGARDVPERQHTLDGAISWSYDLLDEAHRRLLRRLSVFVGGCRIEEAERVCGPAADLGIDPVEGLMDLVDQCLVRRDLPDEPRVTMLETVRAFARDRLADDPEGKAIARRHRVAYRDRAESAAPRLTRSDQAQWYRLLDRQLDNVRAAIRNSIDSGEPEDGLRIAGGAWRHWVQRGYLREGEELVSSLLAGSVNIDDKPRTLGLIARGSLRYWLGTVADADRDYSAAVATARHSGDSELLALALYNLAFMRMVQPEGMEALDEAIVVLTQQGDPESLAHAAWLRLIIAQISGNVEDMRARALEALGLFRRIDDTMYTGMCLGSLMFSVLRTAQPPPEELRQGLAWGFEALRLYHSVGDVTGSVVTLFGAARLLTAVGEMPAGLRARGAAERVGQRYRVQIPRQFTLQLGIHPAEEARKNGMSEQEIEQYMVEGSQLSLSEAIEEVLGLQERLLRALGESANRARAAKAFS